jgi:hypothetical protein
VRDNLDDKDFGMSGEDLAKLNAPDAGAGDAAVPVTDAAVPNK